MARQGEAVAGAQHLGVRPQPALPQDFSFCFEEQRDAIVERLFHVFVQRDAGLNRDHQMGIFEARGAVGDGHATRDGARAEAQAKDERD